MKIEKKEKMPAGEAIDLAKAVDYADSAVVSRTLAHNAAGSVTLFAFAAGEVLSEHTSPYDAIVQIVDGEAMLTIGGRKVRAAAGRMVLMPANVPHAVAAVTRFKMLLTMLKA